MTRASMSGAVVRRRGTIFSESPTFQIRVAPIGRILLVSGWSKGREVVA